MANMIGTKAWIDGQVKDATDNRANQLNPNNSAYWSSRSTPVETNDKNILIVGVAILGVAALAAAGLGIYNCLKNRKCEAVEEEDIDSEDE